LQMSVPFETSRRKIAWAEKRLEELYWEIENFRQRNPYKKLIEPDSDQPENLVHKMVFTDEIPDSTLNLTAEIVNCLRTALDNAIFDVALATGKTAPRNAAFPFAGTIQDMPNALGRCKDVPSPVHSLCCGLQPYEGGNEALWALNKLSNTDKHQILQPFGTGVVRTGASVRGTGYFSMPDPHKWDSKKNEMEIIRLGPDTTFDYHFDFAIFIAFDELTGLAGKSVIQTLATVGTATQCAVNAIEAECRRLKYI
jgi:hypothetical protein